MYREAGQATERLMARGVDQVRNGAVEAGIALLEAARDLGRSGDTLANLAVAYALAGRRADARRAFQEALRLLPNDPRLREDLAVFMRGEVDGAGEAAVAAAPRDLTLLCVKSQADFDRCAAVHQQIQRDQEALASRLPRNWDQFAVQGYCHVCQRETEFQVDAYASQVQDGVRRPNWRERVVCPLCGLNNRSRAAVHLLDHLFQPSAQSRIYVAEQTTPLYRQLAARFPGTLGSEHLGDRVPRGQRDARGIRNEDLTALTFADGSVDLVLTFDVLEHVPDYRAAIVECVRVLAPGGGFLFTVPFAPGSEATIVRAASQPDGTIRHLLPPEYHGDPCAPEAGCLCYQVFGWDLLSTLESAGFGESAAYFLWSPDYGYLGDPQIIFAARRAATHLLRAARRGEATDHAPEAYAATATPTLGSECRQGATTVAESPRGIRAAARDAALVGFCAAPWVEGVLKTDGRLLTCCRNGRLLGNWQTDGLAAAWHSAAYREFREAIRDGRIPDEACRCCLANGTARSLTSEFASPAGQYLRILQGHFKQELPDVFALGTLLDLRQADARSGEVLEQYLACLKGLRGRLTSAPAAVQQAANKLVVIGEVTRAFLDGMTTPAHVAPLRQVQLNSRCNARCIQCPGLHTGEIFDGPHLDPRHLEEVFAARDDIIDFFMNGSEFLLYPAWKQVAEHLAAGGVKLSISTNGILLSPSNVRWLLDRDVLQKLNVSMDGACPATVEAIRVHVKFDRLIQNLAFIFYYGEESKRDFTLSVSFVLMRRNHQEFPAMIRLIHRLRGMARRPSVHVFCQALEHIGHPGYQAFVREEHHGLVPREELIRTFDAARQAAAETGIEVGAFYAYSLEDFIRRGYPFPPMPAGIEQAAAGV